MNSKVTMGIRILLGVLMLVFGLNKFFGFMPMPEMTGDAGTLMGIYSTSGFFTIIGIIEVLGGLALIVGKFIPLALTFLIAVLFNAVLFHIFHFPEGIAPAIFGLVMGLIMVYAHKDRFSTFLAMD